MVWPGRPSTSPVCAKRSTCAAGGRAYRPRSLPTSRPRRCPVDVSVPRYCGWPGPPSSMVKASVGAGVTGRRSVMARHVGPVGDCRRPGGVQRRRRRRGAPGAAVARRPRAPALGARPSAAAARPPPRAALAALRRHPVDQVARPGIRDDDARGDDDGQRDRRPHADRVVPVEVARLAGEAAAEPDDLFDRAPGPACAGSRGRRPTGR